MKGQHLLPICAQTGFSLEKPIELAEAQDVYAWVSHNQGNLEAIGPNFAQILNGIVNCQPNCPPETQFSKKDWLKTPDSELLFPKWNKSLSKIIHNSQLIIHNSQFSSSISANIQPQILKLTPMPSHPHPPLEYYTLSGGE